MTHLQIENIQVANTRELAAWRNLISTAFSGFEQLISLNLGVTRFVLFDGMGNTKSTFAAGAIHPVPSMPTWPATPLLERSMAYGRSVCAVATETSAELGEVIDSTLAEGHQMLADTVDSIARTATTATNPLFAALKIPTTSGQ